MSMTSNDPFATLDRLLARSGFGDSGAARSLWLPVDVYREGEEYIVEVDVPGMDPNALDLTVERNMLSLSGERPARHSGEALLCERPHARFTRQLYLGENLDTENLQANYEHGVLTIRIPMTQQARSRKVEITAEQSGTEQSAIDTSSSER